MNEKNEVVNARRGFAALTPERRREVARLGGKSVPAEKRGFSTNPVLQKAAASKGGKSVSAEKRTFARDPEAAKAAGRKGGLAKAARMPISKPEPDPDLAFLPDGEVHIGGCIP